MKKKTEIKSKIWLFILIVIVLSGCSNETSNDGTSTNSALKKVKISNLETTGITQKYHKEDDTYCPSFENAIYVDDTYFVSNEDGVAKRYEYNLNKKYSNGTNCKLVNEYPKEALYVAYKKNHTCDYLYKLKADMFVVFTDYTYSALNPTTTSYNNGYCGYFDDYIWVYNDYYYWEGGHIIKNRFLGNDIKYQDVENAVNVDFEYYKNYPITVESSKVYNSGIPDAILLKLSSNESVIKVLDGIIITNKNVYIPGIVDYGCYEFADGSCKSGYKKNEELSKLIDDISLVTESYVVFKDGTTYSMWDPMEFGEEEVW